MKVEFHAIYNPCLKVYNNFRITKNDNVIFACYLTSFVIGGLSTQVMSFAIATHVILCHLPKNSGSLPYLFTASVHYYLLH